MRNHKPQYRLAKERDYLAIEMRSFVNDLSTMLAFFPRDGWPSEMLALLDVIKGDIEKYDLRRMGDHQEEARKLAWKYIKTPHKDHASFLLQFAVLLNSMFRLDTKQPDNYDAGLRPKDH